MLEFANMTKDDLEATQVEKEKEYQDLISSLETIELKEIEISQKIAELQVEKKKLSSSLLKGRHALRTVASEMRVIKTYIYKRLRGE